MKQLVNKLIKERSLSHSEWEALIAITCLETRQYVMEQARATAQAHYGNKVFVRGLIEMTNFCRNNCYYCGIRAGNTCAERYRLTTDEILWCCEQGDKIGFKTFVIQGGEDPYYKIDDLIELVKTIRQKYPEHAITLSLGEMSYNDYKALYDAGANRYLLRHETANNAHYQQLHPKRMSLEVRKQALMDLKAIGYQVGSGFMVGSPYQTMQTLAEDMLFLTKLQPQMVGIGPFLPHEQTPFKEKQAGNLDLTIYILSLIRLLLPKVLLPATTALATLNNDGRALGILAGANVVMPNISPMSVREKYMLYNNKAATGMEAIEGMALLQSDLKNIGYEIDFSRGDAR